MNRWGEKTSDDSETIKPHTWNEYFKKLLNKPISDTPPGHHDPTFHPILDGVITVDELRSALKQLKPHKAAGPDGILAEDVKAFGETYVGILLKVLKEIFCRHSIRQNGNPIS